MHQFFDDDPPPWTQFGRATLLGRYSFDVERLQKETVTTQPMLWKVLKTAIRASSRYGKREGAATGVQRRAASRCTVMHRTVLSYQLVASSVC